MTWILIAVASFVAAGMNSIAGGGTFVTFPVLTGIAGWSEKVANMSSTIGLWPGSAASIFPAWPDLRRVPRGMLLAYGVISLLGGGAGAILLLTTSAHAFGLIIPWLLLLATLIFAFSKPIARWAGRQQGGQSLKWTFIVGAIQVAVAVYGGYFGAGIGVLMLAGLSFTGLEDIHQMNALKVFLATLINLVAAIIFLFGSRYTHQVADRVDWPIVLTMALVSIVGGVLGMVAARRVKRDQLRLMILLIGIVLSGYYFYRNYKWMIG